MKYASCALAATLVIGGLFASLNVNGRIADETQKNAVRINKSPINPISKSRQELDHWNPDDTVAQMMAYTPVGGILALGLIITFLASMGHEKQEISRVIFGLIGVAGVAALLIGHYERLPEYAEAEARLVEWENHKVGEPDATWVMLKDSFLSHLVRLKMCTLLVRVGLIGMGLSLFHVVTLAAARRPETPA